MTAPTIPFYPITHDDGINITNSLNGLAGALKNRVIIADDFSTDQTYNVGDYVIHQGDLYRFTTAHSTGEWNSGQVTKVNVGSELKSLKTAIDGKLSLTGGILTGNLFLSGRHVIQNHSIADTSASSLSRSSEMMHQFNDKNNKLIGFVTSYQGTDGVVLIGLTCRREFNNTTYNNYLYLKILNDGSSTIQVSSPVAWRNALGLSDSDWLTATNPSKFTGTVYYRRIGKTVEVRAIDIKLTSGLSASNGISIGNIIPSGYRPSSYVTFPIRYHNDLKNATGLIGTDGNVYVYSPDAVAITTNSTICFTAMYFLTI